jgi:plasmid stabilization system protein ParE
VRFISPHDPDAAIRVRARLVEQIKVTADFSKAGRIVPEFNQAQLRELIRNPYRIIYRLDEEAETIEVLRFWHAARGLPKI